MRKGFHHHGCRCIRLSETGWQKASELLFVGVYAKTHEGVGEDKIMAWRNYRRGGTGKYHNHKVERDGEKFDSAKEYRRYCELKLMEKAGMIHGLERQKKFVLIPAQREPDTIGTRGGKHKGKLIERECSYYADFAYYTKDGDYVVEDVKSEATKTEQYKIKRKLMMYVHGIRIQEI